MAKMKGITMKDFQKKKKKELGWYGYVKKISDKRLATMTFNNRINKRGNQEDQGRKEWIKVKKHRGIAA